MILPFSTQINGKPTHFVSKIWVGIESKFSDFTYKGNQLFKFPKEYIECGQKGLLTFQKPKPKLHTIREDKKDRWKAGVMIDFFINTRTKDMYRFAPRIPVVSVQKFEISWARHDNCEGYALKIDDKYLNAEQIYELAQNDGFDTVEEFFEYFNEDFSGKIIQWTDLKY